MKRSMRENSSSVKSAFVRFATELIEPIALNFLLRVVLLGKLAQQLNLGYWVYQYCANELRLCGEFLCQTFAS